MRKLRKAMIRILGIPFHEILVFLNGGVLKLKRRLIRQNDGFMKDLLVYAYEKKLQKMGSWIGYRSVFEEDPVFPHGIQGIFISNGAKIGKNCVIFQQVTIGSNTIENHPFFGSPQLGDGCYLGAGAKLIGKITLGNNVRVGANCVVVKDVGADCVVVAQSPRIIQKEALDNQYHDYR